MVELLKFDPLPRKFTLLFIVMLIVVSAFLRIVNIANVPPGLYQDETAIGYNAYSILQTGKDEYGKSFPLYFESFGDYKLPVYIYLTAFSEKVFGLNEFAVRFPSIVAGVFAVLLVFLLGRNLSKNTTLAFLAATVLAINPIHLFFSRAGFEVNLALTLALAGIYFFIIGTTKKKVICLILSILSFSLCLYSYNETRLIAPLFLIGLVILYWEKLRKFTLRYQALILAIFLLTLLPFAWGFFSVSGVVSAKSTLITSTDTLAKNLEFRSYLSFLPHFYTAFFFNQYIFMAFQYLENIASILSGAFFFVSGTTELNQGIGTVGFFYLFDLPFFMWGLITYFRAKITSFRIFFLWLVTTLLILALSKEVPQATRGYFLVLPSVCFIALGLFSFFYYLSTIKNKSLKYVILIIFVFCTFYNIQFYLLSYFVRFPLVYSDAWRTEDRELSLYLKENESKYNDILIDRNADFVYTTYLFYDNYPPQEFISTAKRHQDGDLIKAFAWGKYGIRQVDWNNDLRTPHTLIVTTQADLPKYAIILRKFYDPTSYNVLSINGTIVNAPQNNVKYILIETDANKNNEKLFQLLKKEQSN